MSKFTAGVRLFLAALATLLLSIPSFASSQVRIVRLSAVQGEVQIDRATGEGFEKAFLNLPVTQGGKIRTGDDGFAEIEFEDGSTLRIAPRSMLDFPQLALEDSGTKVSTVNVQLGTAYVDFAGAKDSQLALTFEKEHVSVTKSTHFRVQVGHTKAEVAVMNGDAQVAGPSGVVELSKKRSALFDLSNQDQYTVAKNVEEASYDAWDKQQSQYHERALQRTASNNSPYMYGMSDLSYYGNYYNVPGYGMMWQPYFAGAGWDPFMNGGWAFYPGAGYSWVSAYPWGWTPYHYGSWNFVSNYGWMWQPGGSWMGLGNSPVAVNAPSGFATPRPPSTPMRTMVMVNRGPANSPALAASSNKMVIRSGSAGLGIPRGSVQNLGKLSQQVQTRGTATTTIHSAAPPPMYSGMAGRGAAGRGMAPNGQPAARSASQRAPSGNSNAGAARQSAPAPSYHPSPSPSSAGAGGGGARTSGGAGPRR